MTPAKRFIRIILTALLAFATAFAAFGCRSISDVLTPATSGSKETGPVPAPLMDGGYYVATESFVALDNGGYFVDEPLPGLPWSTEEYAVIKEHGFISVLSKPFSTFGADIDTASYCNLRRMIRQGLTLDQIPAGAVRIEEMLNYFTYDYAGPKPGTGDLFGVTCTIADCPWSPDTKLLILGLQAKEAPVQSAG
ncbi:MAG: von Willebrand factor type A domain-containing protein, partial [Eggerthellaceae bacterium]|nr:von Willebrand factor type A domain-containing protein [Eggerthellaceae bacterium]